ncbi:MAG: hypothetical protein J0L61_08320 [Planctomycetes bacterium]|nr:hypothetical protein [Planctomycetota bacterium]
MENQVLTIGAAGMGVGPGATSQFHNEGGNPENHRRISLVVGTPLSTSHRSMVFSLHFLNSAVHAPASQGAVLKLRYQEDYRTVSPGTGGHFSAPLIRQDGIDYIGKPALWLPVGSLIEWQTYATGDLVAMDFVAIDTTVRTLGLDLSLHPNFAAAGSSMQFGFVRLLDTGIGGTALTAQGAIDNVRIEIITPAACLGDLNGDGIVSTPDLATFLAQFGLSVTPGTGGDFNADGTVSTPDLAQFLSRFGSVCP